MTARPLFDHVVAEFSLALGEPALSEVAGGVVATWRAVTNAGIEYPARVRWMPARPDRVEAIMIGLDEYSSREERSIVLFELPVVVASTNPAVVVHAPEEILPRVTLAPVSAP